MAKRIKSAVKRAEVAERNRQRNVAVKSKIKTAVRKTVEALGGESAADKLKVAVAEIDKAVSKGILHKNAAARRKSRLAKKVNAGS